MGIVLRYITKRVHFYTVYVMQKYVHALYLYRTNNLALDVNIRSIVVILEDHYIPKQHNFQEPYTHFHTTFVTLSHYLSLLESHTKFSGASNSTM